MEIYKGKKSYSMGLPDKVLLVKCDPQMLLYGGSYFPGGIRILISNHTPLNGTGYEPS